VIDTVAAESKRLEHLVDLFLDDVSVDDVLGLRVRKQQVDIAALVWEEGHAEWQRNPHVDLEIDAPPGPAMISTDPLRVREVLVNLLDNAAKYGGSRPVVTMHLTVGPAEARIDVADRGPGVARDDQARIFERTYRGTRGAAVGKPGLGMGLYISKEIVDALGGRLELRSALGHGSTFSLVLPATAG
jgi:signal transduction histidine kinase